MSSTNVNSCCYPNTATFDNDCFPSFFLLSSRVLLIRVAEIAYNTIKAVAPGQNQSRHGGGPRIAALFHLRAEEDLHVGDPYFSAREGFVWPEYTTVASVSRAVSQGDQTAAS